MMDDNCLANVNTCVDACPLWRDHGSIPLCRRTGTVLGKQISSNGYLAAVSVSGIYPYRDNERDYVNISYLNHSKSADLTILV